MTGAPPSRTVMIVSPYGIENRGTRYITAVLRAAGFRPCLVLFKRWVNNGIEPPTETEERLLADLARRLDPLLIGIGFGAPYLQIVTRLTARLRESVAAPILWGGVFPTVCPDECIGHADYVCVGEGEHPTLDLCQALAAGARTDAIPNLWARRGTEVVRNAPRPLLRDLDTLPVPDLGAPDTWFIEDGRLRETDPIAGTAEYRIYPTRGCPYACTYCHNSVLRELFRGHGAFYRMRSVENVIAELELAQRRLPRIRRVKFDGDVFAFPEAWIREFADQYRRRIGRPFELLTYPGELDEDDLVRLRKAGLCKVQTGIQSGSDDEVRTVYGRRSTTSSVLDFARTCRRARVPVVFDLIFDNPLAGRDDKRRMIELLLALPRPFKIYIYSLTVFPRTALAKDLLERGLIGPDDIEGRATKSFRQFRLSLDYPRPREDTFWICLAILSSKSFVPRAVVRRLMRSEWLRDHPAPLKLFAQVSDLVKDAWIAADMLMHGELTMFKLRQYGSFRRLISQ